MLCKLIEEGYTKLIEESPHKDNPFLNKYIKRNQEFRKNLAEKLRFLRQRRDYFRQNLNPFKANLIDNVARSLTRASAGDETLKKLVTTKLDEIPKQERASLFTYRPKMITVPREKLNLIKERIDKEKVLPVYGHRRISNYLSKEDVDNLQKSLRITNDRHVFDDNFWEMFKYAPRMAATIREPNPLLDYNVPKRATQYYNVNYNPVYRNFE